MAKHGGWAGKVLRVDLSSGRISTEDTIEKYKDYLGGTGIGYKVIWDEVPEEQKPSTRPIRLSSELDLWPAQALPVTAERPSQPCGLPVIQNLW